MPLLHLAEFLCFYRKKSKFEGADLHKLVDNFSGDFGAGLETHHNTLSESRSTLVETRNRKSERTSRSVATMPCNTSTNLSFTSPVSISPLPYLCMARNKISIGVPKVRVDKEVAGTTSSEKNGHSMRVWTSHPPLCSVQVLNIIIRHGCANMYKGTRVEHARTLS